MGMVVKTCSYEELLFREVEGLVIVISGTFNGLIKTMKERTTGRGMHKEGKKLSPL